MNHEILSSHLFILHSYIHISQIHSLNRSCIHFLYSLKELLFPFSLHFCLAFAPQLRAEPLGLLHDAALRRMGHEQRLSRRLQRLLPRALAVQRLRRGQQRRGLSSVDKTHKEIETKSIRYISDLHFYTYIYSRYIYNNIHLYIQIYS